MACVRTCRFLLFALCILLACFAIAAPPSGKASAWHLQTIDVVTMTKDGAEWDAQLTRQLGIGMDGKPGTTFDAVLVDRLPSGMHLLSPDPGTLHPRAVDGSACPLTLSVHHAQKAESVQLDFHRLPTLPEGKQCCDCTTCGGNCGRACSVNFSYCTSAACPPGQAGTVQVSSSVLSLQAGKTGTVVLYITARPVKLRDTTLRVTIPDAVNGAKIHLKRYSPALHRVSSAPRLTRLATKKPFLTISLTIELAVTPSKAGTITLSDFAELYGLSNTPVRSAPCMLNAPHVVAEHKTYLRIKRNIEISAV